LTKDFFLLTRNAQATKRKQAPEQQQRSVVVRAEAEADVDKLVKDLSDKVRLWWKLGGCVQTGRWGFPERAPDAGTPRPA